MFYRHQSSVCACIYIYTCGKADVTLSAALPHPIQNHIPEALEDKHLRF